MHQLMSDTTHTSFLIQPELTRKNRNTGSREGREVHIVVEYGEISAFCDDLDHGKV